MKKVGQQICVECKKRKRIAFQVGLKAFCGACWKSLMTQPEIRHRHQITLSQDLCSCEHSAGEHTREKNVQGRSFGPNDLDVTV